MFMFQTNSDMWCVSPVATAKEGPPWFVWVTQRRNEGSGTRGVQGHEEKMTEEKGVLDSLDNAL